MDRVALDLGFIQIYWYSIFVFLGLLTATILIYREGKRQNIKEDDLINLIFYSVIIGIFGARLYYVIFNLSYYLKNPLEILAIWNGGLAIHGGIIAGLLFILFYCHKHKIEILRLLDITVVGLIIAQAIGRWGNFFNSEAYGAITTLSALESQHIPKFIIDGMYIMGEYRQPTFLYESMWCLLGFIIMLLIRKYNKKILLGNLASFYLVWYGIERLFVEGLRSDSLMLGQIKVAQLVSLIFIISGTILFIYVNKILKNNKLYHIEQEKNKTKKLRRKNV